MPSSSLNMSTRKILSRWAKEDYCVYMRPVSSRMIDARSKHSVYWIVSVELHAVPPGNWREEGPDLDELIERLDKIVPRNRTAHRKSAGWLAPNEVFEREKAEIAKRTRSESPRPKKRPKKEKKRASRT